jgi:hypothetical protein
VTSSEWAYTIVAGLVMVAVAWVLYRPRLQQAPFYQALVVPLANIMDVGFLVLTPLIVLLVGFDSPIFMLLICLIAGAAGLAITYNIRHYEPLVGTPDRINGLATVGQWALFGASIANIAYYTQLLATLVLWPIDLYSPGRVTLSSVLLLALLILVGYRYGLASLNHLGERTTAFNLAALAAIVTVFVAFNLNFMLRGEWGFGDYNPPNDPDRLRKLLGFFAMVQGFEASRYIGMRFSADLRVTTMRWAQLVSTTVFVLLVTSVLFVFEESQPDRLDGTTIFVASKAVAPTVPFMILLAALGSQLSAIVNATSSRSDLLIEVTKGGLQRRYTFPVLLVPAITVILFTNVTAAVALASRVFAAYFLLQAGIAGTLAYRAQSWPWLAAFVAVGLMMATIMVFGLPV